MIDMVISNAIGFVLGIVASFVSWWILFHGLIPKVVFADAICKSPTSDDPSGWKYRFGFGNVGRRSLVDVQVSARLSMRRGHDSTIYDNVTLSLNWEGDKKLEIPLFPKSNFRRYRIFAANVAEFLRSNQYSEDIHAKAADGSLSLAELLSPNGQATLRVYVAGYDELSGARRVFQSKAYKLENIVEGEFRYIEVIASAKPSQAEPLKSDA